MISKSWPNALILTELEGSDDVENVEDFKMARQISEYVRWFNVFCPLAEKIYFIFVFLLDYWQLVV